MRPFDVEFPFVDAAQRMTRIATELHEQGSVAGVLTALTRIAARDVPGAQRAGITRNLGSAYTSVAPTDDIVVAVDEIQYALRSGPCVSASSHGSVFWTGDLRTDERWPEFGARAYGTAGILSMLSYRIYLEDDRNTVGALNMYSTERDAFDDSSRFLALLLATHCAEVIGRAAARENVAHLQRALLTSREIGAAMGIVMNLHRVTRDQAFDLLRVLSQNLNRTVADIATEVTDTGRLPDPVPLARRRPARRLGSGAQERAEPTISEQ